MDPDESIEKELAPEKRLASENLLLLLAMELETVVREEAEAVSLMTSLAASAGSAAGWSSVQRLLWLLGPSLHCHVRFL